ncbi:hypothetical protein [Pontiella sulfatireligans]|nr:hypothetical protein [Pontiella sulfatireligans]
MKSIKLLATVTVLSLLAGCATTFRPWLLSDVHEGMDKVQVVQLLGTPDSTETKNGAEYLHYSFREDLTLPFSNPGGIEFSAEREIMREDMERRFKDYRYVVILVDGKVVNYKEELPDPSQE